ncbi:MAG: MAPEG family protein [Spirochaetota bacterium]
MRMLQENPSLLYLLYSALLYWGMLLFASLAHARGWTLPGMKIAMGNRDNLPPEPRWVGRAHRAARNMGENLLIFAVVVIVAVWAKAPHDSVTTGAQIFFFARLAYFAVYLAGIPYLRTVVWAVALGGIAIIAGAVLSLR